MSASQWVCRRCIKALAQPRNRQFLRFASTDAKTKMPPLLLQRARILSDEHDKLASALEEDYDIKVAKRVGELSRVADALKKWDTAQSSILELNGLLESDDSELRKLAKDELSTTTAKIDTLATSLSASLTPRDPFADMPCLLEVRPGPGGMEGRYFADAIFRMYKMYCARKGMRCNVLKREVVDGTESTKYGVSENPLQEAILEILDPGAYDMFRGEAGIHRVQRVPTTESSGRTHTSAVAVWVLPLFPRDDAAQPDEASYNNPDSIFYIDPKDVREERMRASGAGGQHVNKTESAIRLTHDPTGITVSMQDSRSQHQNRESAWTLLRSRISQRRREEREEEAWALRNSVLSKDQISRGTKIRTYNYGQDRCTDHRGGLDVHNLSDVLDGGESLDKLMDSTKGWLIGRDIAALIAEEEAGAAPPPKEGKKAKK
ncbi:release factor [Annulohypoxylon maeteangense]|uniref:release factor n=1 Tax=Annulohypoxylon maeteangense TaxID=1927788 RepID=UPI002007C51C|nr:release factor [Annulohypoxylon maeteangense]KAI0880250.1 release factor [Annulohypoxylon maeteangense]